MGFATTMEEANGVQVACRWKAGGVPEKKEVWLASKVIPMGWIDSVSLFQHLHRRIGLEPEPLGAGLEGSTEMPGDRAVPTSATKKEGGWLSFYLDYFDCPEIIQREMANELKGRMSSMHLKQREAYRRTGVEFSADKAHVREVRVERMGAEVDGEGG